MAIWILLCLACGTGVLAGTGDYSYAYRVSDPSTGDVKSHEEVRKAGEVRGAYSLLEPDGTLRVVEYAVRGPAGGFSAILLREKEAGGSGFHHGLPLPMDIPDRPTSSFSFSSRETGLRTLTHHHPPSRYQRD